MLVVCVGVHAVMCLLRVLRVSAWLALPAGLVALAVLIGLIYFRDSTRFGIPTGDTIEQFRISMRLVWRQFPQRRLAGTQRGKLCDRRDHRAGVCALACRLVRVPGRSGEPRPSCRPASCSSSRRRSASTATAFSSPRCGSARRSSRLPRCAWLMLATTRHGWASGGSRCGRRCRRRLPVRCSRRPEPLRSRHSFRVPATRRCSTRAIASGDVTEVVSPLVDIRSRLVNEGNVELFTVKTEHAAVPRPDGARQVRWHADGRRCPKTRALPTES